MGTATADKSHLAQLLGDVILYDGTTVVAPQPVFRALTDTVHVRYTYRGRPGKIAVDAELSTVSGWRSTIQLKPVQPLKAKHEGQVRLDLSELEDRAKAAAAVITITTRQQG